MTTITNRVSVLATKFDGQTDSRRVSDSGASRRVSYAQLQNASSRNEDNRS